MAQYGDVNAVEAGELADLFCREARRRIKDLFSGLWANDDKAKSRVAADILAERHRWLEKGGLTLDELAETEAPVADDRAAESTGTKVESPVSV